MASKGSSGEHYPLVVVLAEWPTNLTYDLSALLACVVAQGLCDRERKML
jgi:hypothetical protein